MKKSLTILLTIILVVTASFCLTACESEEDKAIADLEKFVADYDEQYPNGVLTPNYVRDYLVECGYSQSVVDYAMENGNVNWTLYAKRFAEPYLTYDGYDIWYGSSELREFLSSGELGYSASTIDEVILPINWKDQAKKFLQNLSKMFPEFSRKQAMEYLQNMVASEGSMEYFLENSGINWSAHALNIANVLRDEVDNNTATEIDEATFRENITEYKIIELNGYKVTCVDYSNNDYTFVTADRQSLNAFILDAFNDGILNTDTVKYKVADPNAYLQEIRNTLSAEYLFTQTEIDYAINKLTSDTNA